MRRVALGMPQIGATQANVLPLSLPAPLPLHAQQDLIDAQVGCVLRPRCQLHSAPSPADVRLDNCVVLTALA